MVLLAGYGASRAIDDGRAGPVPEPPATGDTGELLSALGRLVPDPPARTAADAHAAGRPTYEIARAVPGASISLRESPGGRVVEKLGAKTEFGSGRSFYIAERRGEWLGVPSAALENDELGWIRDDESAFTIERTSFSITADLSGRMVRIRYGPRVLRRIPVTVGRLGSATPPGLFSVTDGLAGSGIGTAYGCCVMALSGHQPNLPPGWIGGDRIAIHGTPGPVGGAASAGCIRVANRDMVDLFALVPLGTPVFIRR